MSYFPARAQFRSDNAPEPHAHPQHPSANFRPSPPRRHSLRTSSRYPLSPFAPHLCKLSPRGQLPPQAVPCPFSSRIIPQLTSTPRIVPPPTSSPHRRDATPSAHRPATLYHPSLHTSANFLPTANCHPKPFLALFSSRITPSPTFALRTAPRHPLPLPSTTPRSTPLQTSPRLHHHAACFCPAPPAPALFRKGRRGPPAGPGTGSHRPNTHNRPIARTRTKKERHPLPDAAPWNGCAASTRGRRPYRPLRAGRRTRPAYWPQSTPR